MPKILRRILGAAGLLALLGLATIADAQGTSVADAARRAQEQRKQAPKAKKVWTNDNLPTGPGGVSVLGTASAAATAAAAGEAGAEVGAAPAGGSPEEEKERAELENKLKLANEDLTRLKTSLELAKRDYDLQLQQFSSAPDASADRAGRARVDALAAQVAALTQQTAQAEAEVKDLEQKLKDLEARIGPKKEAPKTGAQVQQDWANRARPLREELSRIEAEMARIRAAAAQRGLDLTGRTQGGSPTADLLAQLETQRQDILAKLSALEDEARRAGVPAGWVR